MRAPRPWTCVCGQRNAGSTACSRCLTPPPGDVVASPFVDVPATGVPRWFRPMAVAIAVLLVAGLTSAAVEVADDGGRSPGVAADAGRHFEVDVNQPPPELGGDAGEVAAQVHALMRFVQEARGLPFEAPVNVALLDDADFRKRLAGEDAGVDEDSDVVERVLRAFGLLEPGVDLDESAESFFADAVAGFYDPAEDDLVVRGDELTPGVRATLAHELVHALQDQHFDLEGDDEDDGAPAEGEAVDAVALDDGGEADEAFRALIEGDAVRVQELYSDSLPVEEQKAAELEDMEAASGVNPATPRVLIELFGFPYAFGPSFVTAVFTSGGQARLDEAYRDRRPTSTEHILHPDRYLSGSTTKEIDAPKAPGGKDVIDEGVLGEYGLALVLSRIVSGPAILTAAEGWGGDRYVAWRDGDGACARTRLAMDTAKDASEVLAALRAGARQRERMTVSSTRTAITFTMCG